MNSFFNQPYADVVFFFAVKAIDAPVLYPRLVTRIYAMSLRSVDSDVFVDERVSSRSVHR